MRLVLLRHGQTPANVLGQLDTAVPGAGLTGLGHRQAAEAPTGLTSLASLDGHLPVERLWVSTLVRTQLTAAPLAAATGLSPTVLDGLREIAAGDLEMLDDPTSQGRYDSTCLAWARGDLGVRNPGGENGHEFFRRYDDAVDTILAAGGSTVVAVSHGAAIRVWVAARCIDTGAEFAVEHQLDNTGAAVLGSVDPGGRGAGRWKLDEWHAGPVGGRELHDETAEDPTGEGRASS
ncbi:histidine phosphatase family protein [Frondihabitans cladoniiphilus]|uniref:Histidine phosphatase family protein n=1 Tax=Frondihabitans cladoniiphilus TaxID=715785 RepID=A0ABP8VQL5_9MICO